MKELLEQLQNSQPNRNLDFDVATAIGMKIPKYDPSGWPPRFTDSMDEAMKTIPKTHTFLQLSHYDGEWIACIAPKGTWSVRTAMGASAALAISAAGIYARMP